MPTSENTASASLVLTAATVLALHRQFKFQITRTRLVFGGLAFTAWQRFLASGGTTYTIRSHFYVPADPPEKEQTGLGYPPFPGADSMTGKTALVTGATKGGIGFYTAVGLYRLGANTIVTTRETNTDRIQELMQEIQRAAMMPQAMVGVVEMEKRLHVVNLDLGPDNDIPDAVAGVVKQLDALPDGAGKSIDILINNLGGMFQLAGDSGSPVPRFHHVNQIEMNTAVNAVGPMLLTEALKPRMPIGGRVVHVASEAHRHVKSMSELASLLNGRAVSTSFFSYYGASKFANICYAATQNREDKKHVHFAVHPGMSLTGILRDMSSWNFFRDWGLAPWIEGITSLVLKSPKEASHTSLFCACDPFAPRMAKKEGAVYWVDMAPGNKYLTALAANEQNQEECMRELQRVIDGALERKRKFALRAA